MSEMDRKELQMLEGHGLHKSPAGADSVEGLGENVRPSDEVYTGQAYVGHGKEKQKKSDSVGRDIAVLMVITLAAGLLLGAAYSVTKEPIARAQEEAKIQAQRAVMPDAESFELIASDEEEASGADLAQVSGMLEDAGITGTGVTRIDRASVPGADTPGYVVTSINSEGYGGDVEMMTGISAREDGSLTIEGISFLTLAETAGMGMRAKEEGFTGQFAGRKIGEGELLVYTKNGASADNEIDAISGCTITTSAVTNNVNAALTAVRALQSGAVKAPAQSPETEQEGTE